MAEPRPRELAVAPPARRALASELPEAVAPAVIEFVTGSLLDRPRVVGKPLRGESVGSGRPGGGPAGCYRVLEESHEVVVLSVQHRRDAHRG